VEATAQMELLAQKLDRATVIPAPTANQLERLIGQPGYDCRHVSCSAELAARNEAARTRLEQLLATKGTALVRDEARAEPMLLMSGSAASYESPRGPGR
jgi:hypothetical protein